MLGRALATRGPATRSAARRLLLRPFVAVRRGGAVRHRIRAYDHGLVARGLVRELLRCCSAELRQHGGMLGGARADGGGAPARGLLRNLCMDVRQGDAVQDRVSPDGDGLPLLLLGQARRVDVYWRFLSGP